MLALLVENTTQEEHWVNLSSRADLSVGYIPEKLQLQELKTLGFHDADYQRCFLFPPDHSPDVSEKYANDTTFYCIVGRANHCTPGTAIVIALL